MLLGIVLPSVMSGLSLSLGIANQARHRSQAGQLCQSKMAEIIADKQFDQTSQSGDFGSDYPGYAWTAQVAPTEDAKLSQLDVTVTWQLRGRQYDVTLSTLVMAGGEE